MHPLRGITTGKTALLTSAALGAVLLSGSPGRAEEVPIGETVFLQDLTCLPKGLPSRVDLYVGLREAATVRVFFRRLNPVGGFYWVEARADGLDTFWAILPRPEDRQQKKLDDEWWDTLRTRDWMHQGGRSKAWLAAWLESREIEAAEVWAGAYAEDGRLLERSELLLVEVLDPAECPVALTAREMGWATSLMLGETTSQQAGREPFHWKCDGIVSRYDLAGVRVVDNACRTCISTEGMAPGSTQQDQRQDP